MLNILDLLDGFDGVLEIPSPTEGVGPGTIDVMKG